MKKKEIKSMVWFGKRETEYEINGVRYLVSSRFMPIDVHNLKDDTISDRIEHHINSGFADLTSFAAQDMLMDEKAYLAAGKEACNAARKTE